MGTNDLRGRRRKLAKLVLLAFSLDPMKDPTSSLKLPSKVFNHCIFRTATTNRKTTYDLVLKLHIWMIWHAPCILRIPSWLSSLVNLLIVKENNKATL